MNEFKTPLKKFVSHKIFREIDVGNCLTDKSSFTPFAGLSGVEPLEKNRKKRKDKAKFKWVGKYFRVKIVNSKHSSKYSKAIW